MTGIIARLLDDEALIVGSEILHNYGFLIIITNKQKRNVGFQTCTKVKTLGGLQLINCIKNQMVSRQYKAVPNDLKLRPNVTIYNNKGIRQKNYNRLEHAALAANVSERCTNHRNAPIVYAEVNWYLKRWT